METYTKKQIVEMIPALTPRQVQFYTDEGVVKPLETKSGRGNVRQYTKENLYEFAIIGYLAKIGVSISTIRKVIEQRPFLVCFGRINRALRDKTCDEDFFSENHVHILTIYFDKGELVHIDPKSMLNLKKDDFTPVFKPFNSDGPVKYDAMIHLDLSEIVKGLPR